MENSKRDITPALCLLKEAMAGDIMKFQIGLIAQFDKDDSEIEVSDLFPELTGFLKKVFGIIQKVDEIIEPSKER